MEDKGYKIYDDLNQHKVQDEVSFQHFWQSIHQKIRELHPKAERVFVSLDGIYQKINLETLWNPITKKYLGDELDIQLLSNTKDLLTREAFEATTKSGLVSLFGFPNYRLYDAHDTTEIKTRLSKLKETRKEVQTIASQLSGKFYPQVFLGVDASEANIKRIKKPQVLHLSTHGFFKENLGNGLLNQSRWVSKSHYLYAKNPLLSSGLYFTGADASINHKSLPDSVTENGILTAQEVLNMDLDSTQLVVLSACETGLGKIQNGEGVYGLQRAFLSAGAKYVLMSLWKVDDEVTRFFMQYFYESWVKDQDVRKAYRFAQKKLREADYTSPYYWGAFVLVSR